MRTIATLVITPVIALAALTGCAGGGTARSDETARGRDASVARPSGSPSPDQSASASASGPGLAVAPPGETAEQFLRRWVAIIHYSETTGDTSAMRAISGTGCRSCTEFVSSVERVYRDGGYVRGPVARIVAIEKLTASEWRVSLQAEASEVRQSATAAPEQLSGGPYSFNAFVSHGIKGFRLAAYLANPS